MLALTTAYSLRLCIYFYGFELVKTKVWLHDSSVSVHSTNFGEMMGSGSLRECVLLLFTIDSVFFS